MKGREAGDRLSIIWCYSCLRSPLEKKYSSQFGQFLKGHPVPQDHSSDHSHNWPCIWGWCEANGGIKLSNAQLPARCHRRGYSDTVTMLQCYNVQWLIMIYPATTFMLILLGYLLLPTLGTQTVSGELVVIGHAMQFKAFLKRNDEMFSVHKSNI